MLKLRRTKDNRPADTSPVAVVNVDSLGVPVPISDDDPLMAYLLAAGGPVDIDRLDLDSPALFELRAQNVHLVVPLISQGELIGTLNLGRRLSDQPYSSDDRKLLAGLASQVAPAIRLAQLVQRQEAEAKERERIDQELRVAALIQQTLLPKEVPSLPGWEIDPYYRPARAVGGDFYDFIPMDDGRLGLVIGDVTDKGVPAALVMATTRSTLRAAAQRHRQPGKILAEANDVLCPEIPPSMFVTCLVGILEPDTGTLVFANAGHNLPYVRTKETVVELRATGMPLGLMPGMVYEEQTTSLEPGATMLLTSDGIVEAHGPDGSMFGFERLMRLVGSTGGSHRLISTVLEELDRFTGIGHTQEDDVTMVSIGRRSSLDDLPGPTDRDVELDRFSVPSEEGNERIVAERVTAAAIATGLVGEPLDRLKTAVSEAAMNAIEHGNGFDPSVPVTVTVFGSVQRLLVRIEDAGSGPVVDGAVPNLDAKLAGTQSPRGWGLFLIDQMVDELRHDSSDGRHTIELVMNLEGAS